MPGFRRKPLKKTIAKKANPHTMTGEQFEHFIKTNPIQAIDFCNSKSIDFARQGDTEMSNYWKERAQKIRDQNR